MKAKDRNSRDVADRFWAKVKEAPGCWEWTAARAGKGYGVFRLSDPRRMVYAHRMAWELTNGPIFGGLFVCHHCDNPICVRPNHLFLGTNADNLRDLVAKGRFKVPPRHGENNGRAKLTAEDVQFIRANYKNDSEEFGVASFARKFSIGSGAIYKILSGASWVRLLQEARP